MAIFTGSAVALVTPFKDNGDVDFDKLKELVEFHVAHKTDAIVICGTTGEAATLSHEEHLECIKKCVEFKKSNLLKDSYPQSCHLIVCRNVLIYFTEDAKLEIYKKFNDSLVKGGCLFVGNTEQIINYKDLGYESSELFFYRKK